MASYKSRVRTDRPFRGVQVVLSTPLNVRVAATVTDDEGFYEFNDIPTGPYILKFYGRDYTIDDNQNIFVVNKDVSLRYFLVSESGNVFTSEDQTLSVQLFISDDNGQRQVNSGDVAIYKKNASGGFDLQGYSVDVSYGDFDETAVYYARREDGTIFDYIAFTKSLEGTAKFVKIDPETQVVREDEKGNLYPDWVKLEAFLQNFPVGSQVT